MSTVIDLSTYDLFNHADHKVHPAQLTQAQIKHIQKDYPEASATDIQMAALDYYRRLQTPAPLSDQDEAADLVKKTQGGEGSGTNAASEEMESTAFSDTSPQPTIPKPAEPLLSAVLSLFAYVDHLRDSLDKDHPQLELDLPIRGYRVLSPTEVGSRLGGVSRWAIYDREKTDDNFPKRVWLGEKRYGYFEHELDHYLIQCQQK